MVDKSVKIFLVIESQTGYWSFQNIFDSDAFIACYLAQNVAKVKRDRSCEMNFEVPEVFILHDVILIELCETVINKFVTVRLFKVLKNKLRKAIAMRESVL